MFPPALKFFCPVPGSQNSNMGFVSRLKCTLKISQPEVYFRTSQRWNLEPPHGTCSFVLRLIVTCISPWKLMDSFHESINSSLSWSLVVYRNMVSPARPWAENPSFQRYHETSAGGGQGRTSGPSGRKLTWAGGRKGT